jgi:lysophospholipase L1-like esterase
VIKFLQSVFYLLCFSLPVSAQSGDTSYRNTYYDQKVSLFRSLPDTRGEIIFLGNSITDGGEWAEIWQNDKVKNRGISSDNTFGVLARLDEIVSSQPAKVFIMIGINDIGRNTPDSLIISNYRKIVSSIRAASPKTKIFVQSILPTNKEFKRFTNHYNKDNHVQIINAALQQFAVVFENTIYVDLYSRFVDSQGRLDKAYTNDGLHLTGAGYLHWKNILLEKGHMK